MMRKSILTLVIGGFLSVFVFGQSAKGSIILFDPDGPAPANPAVPVGSFDFLPGNSLNQGAIGATAPFTVLFQARLGNLMSPANAPITPAGLNSTFEITAVARFDLAATFIPGGFTNTTNTIVVPSPKAYLEIYYDNNPLTFANELAGTGFNDGQLILRAMPLTGGGTFGDFNQIPPLAFDQYGPNNDYPNTLSRTGVGGLSLTGSGIVAQPGFFSNPLQLISVNALTMNSAPFDKVDPSALFWNGTALVPANVGPINLFSGPDVQLQTDASASFVIPEPGSLMLLAVGATVLGLRRRRA